MRIMEAIGSFDLLGHSSLRRECPSDHTETIGIVVIGLVSMQVDRATDHGSVNVAATR